MFERFLAAFDPNRDTGITPPASATVGSWLDLAGGRTPAEGLHRVHTTTSASAADALVGLAFPELAKRLAYARPDGRGRAGGSTVRTRQAKTPGGNAPL